MKRKLKIVRRRTILAFYNAVLAGVFVNEPAARTRIELRFFKAQQEGRIK